MQRQITFFIALALWAAVAPTVTPAAEHGAPLQLTIALSRVITDNPRLAAFSREVREADARALQAGLPLNPVLRTELENVAGSGAFSGAGQAETTVLLSQTFELGGKRARRRHAIELAGELALRDYERARAAALSEAAVAFVEVLAEQQLVTLAGEAIELADQVLATVRRRVDAGSSSRVELTRAEIAHSTARLDGEQRVRALKAARQRLAATWGANVTDLDFETVAGTFGGVRPIPTLEELRSEVDANPEVARWTTELARRNALVEVEESRAIPDITLGAGYRRLSGPDENAIVAELSLPLPLFDRNQGAIREARERALRALDERRAVEVDLDAELATSYERLTAAHAESRTLAEVILPGADETFRSLRAGYREGRFSYLEVLDAQRTLVTTRSRRVHALADYHRAIAAIERLTGRLPTAGLGIAPDDQEQSK